MKEAAKKVAGGVEGLACCGFYMEHGSRIRISNAVKQFNQEIPPPHSRGAFLDGNPALMPVCTRLRPIGLFALLADFNILRSFHSKLIFCGIFALPPTGPPIPTSSVTKFPNHMAHIYFNFSFLAPSFLPDHTNATYSHSVSSSGCSGFSVSSCSI